MYIFRVFKQDPSGNRAVFYCQFHDLDKLRTFLEFHNRLKDVSLYHIRVFEFCFEFNGKDFEDTFLTYNW